MPLPMSKIYQPTGIVNPRAMLGFRCVGDRVSRSSNLGQHWTGDSCVAGDSLAQYNNATLQRSSFDRVGDRNHAVSNDFKPATGDRLPREVNHA
jgi:hypothetical protein